MGKAFDPSLIVDFIPTLIYYLGVTLQILAASVLLGMVIGIAAAILRIFRIPVVNQFVILYISFIRGTPILIQLFLVFMDCLQSCYSLILIFQEWMLCILSLLRMH